MLVLVRGSGDVASAVAYALHTEQHQIVIHETLKPSYIRRGMAFTNAMFKGSVVLEGVLAKRVDANQHLLDTLRSRHAIPVAASNLPEIIELVHPAVVVDARMRKREVPENQRHLAPLTIGLGPNFIAGQQTDLVIETAWGNRLGEIVYTGSSLPLSGEPRPIQGVRRERYLYAPASGIFTTLLDIGDFVRTGDAVARIGTIVLTAPITGFIRGICYSGVPVEKGGKVVEIDPRLHSPDLFGIGERPRRIAQGVRDALARFPSKHEENL